MRAFRTVVESRRWKRPGAGALGVGIVSLVVLVAWATPGLRSEVSGHPRARLFPSDPTGIVEEALGKSGQPARLSILFHPEPARCAPEQIQVIGALERLADEYDDLAVFSVLPKSIDFDTIAGAELPGRIVRISPESWHAANELSPRPRLEVWSADGRLLLLRSLPRTVSEEEIHEEVLWTRSFTEPAAR